MSMMKTRWMEITLMGGHALKFKFPVQVADENAAQRIEEVLKLPTLSISADDKLYVIPTANIQTITISPAPKKLPRSVIRGATLVS
jgi:hypothetical protein